MKKVMLVEDEEFILHGLEHIIDWGKLGLEIVHLAYNGAEALEKLKQEKVDIIVTDLNMPEMGGLELLKHIREEDERTRFIILTGYDEFEYARKAISLDVENYILKPIDEEELESQLKKTLVRLERIDSDKKDPHREADILDEVSVGEIFERRTGTISADSGT